MFYDMSLCQVSVKVYSSAIQQKRMKHYTCLMKLLFKNLLDEF